MCTLSPKRFKVIKCSVSGGKRNDDGCFVRQLFEERNRAENQIVELNKTIKAKEQECEELKDKLNCRFCYPIMKIDDPENFKLCQETECFRRQLDQLKKENEELKEQLQCCECKWWKQLDQLKAENEELKEELDFQKSMYECARADEEDKFEEIIELKQTLEEIREIAKENVRYFPDGEMFARSEIEQIIKIINEVIND